MIDLCKCKKLFIDFDGVIVNSNRFKEIAIRRSINKVIGKNKKSLEAINYFNMNAGISRKEKLSLFFNINIVNEVLKIYSEECKKFFIEARPTYGLKEFLKYFKSNHSYIKIFVLSGGEKNEIDLFLKRNSLLTYFEEILASNKSKIDHLIEKEVCENDIFIGDSRNDLLSSLKTGLKFILFEEYKSKESFPEKELIENNVFLKTQNFSSLIKTIIS